MKAFLLAAGIGSRLRPITDEIPKCLVPINGQPLLYYWLKLFERYGIDEVLINLHHKPELVIQYLDLHDFNLNIQTVYEQELLGSAGTIRCNFNFVCKESSFLICYADNLTNINLVQMIKFHQAKRPILTLGLFHANNPRQCGIAEIDEHSWVIDFVEKPANPNSNLANAGIYVASHEIFHFLPEHFPSDIGYNVLPELLGEMQGYIIHDYIIDIGTIENYERARREFIDINTKIHKTNPKTCQITGNRRRADNIFKRKGHKAHAKTTKY